MRHPLRHLHAVEGVVPRAHQHTLHSPLRVGETGDTQGATTSLTLGLGLLRKEMQISTPNYACAWNGDVVTIKDGCYCGVTSTTQFKKPGSTDGSGTKNLMFS